MSKTEHDALSEVRNGLVRVAIAYTGKFEQGEKKFTISAKDLEQMRRNLAAREIPLDYEHLSAKDAAPGWSRASGWLKSADAIEDFGDGRKVLWGWAEFTAACLAQIRQKEYRYFSPEIHWNDTDEEGKRIGTRLAAGAITNRPFLKDLPPIEISATDYAPLLDAVALSEAKRLIDVGTVHVPAPMKGAMTVKQFKLKKLAEGEHKGKTGVFEDATLVGLGEGEPVTMKAFQLKKVTAGEHSGKHGVFEGDEIVGLVDDALMRSYAALCMPDPDDEGDAEAMKAKHLTEARRADTLCLTEFAKAKPGEVLTLAEKMVEEGRLTMPGFIRAQKIERLIDGAITGGRLLPKQRASMFALAIADYDAAAAMLKDAAPVVDLKTHGIAGEGSTSATAREELKARTTTYMNEHKGSSYADALRAVTAQDPAFYEKYKKEQAVMMVSE